MSRLSTTSFDVVVADVRMPGIGGVELFEQAERQHPELADRFIFVTGEPGSAPIAAFLEARRTPCMSKPIDLNDLAAAVERRGMSARAAS